MWVVCRSTWHPLPWRGTHSWPRSWRSWRGRSDRSRRLCRLVDAPWTEKVNCQSSCDRWGTRAPTLTLRAVVAASFLPFHLSDPTHTSLIASPNLEPHREGISRNVLHLSYADNATALITNIPGVKRTPVHQGNSVAISSGQYMTMICDDYLRKA